MLVGEFPGTDWTNNEGLKCIYLYFSFLYIFLAVSYVFLFTSCFPVIFILWVKAAPTHPRPSAVIVKCDDSVYHVELVGWLVVLGLTAV